MPLNYETVRDLLQQYQSKPTKAAGVRLEREVQVMLELDETETLNDFEWAILSHDLDWDEILIFFRTNKSNYARDLFIGALIDILNERNLLPA